jgi:hypothetical protein
MKAVVVVAGGIGNDYNGFQILSTILPNLLINLSA